MVAVWEVIRYNKIWLTIGIGQVKKLEKRVSAVLVAAGSSTRMGFDKLSFDLGGETVLHRSIHAFEQDPLVTEIVLVAGKNRAFVEQLSLIHI